MGPGRPQVRRHRGERDAEPADAVPVATGRVTCKAASGFAIGPMRIVWTALTDDQLLGQCAVDTYRASGPGGQKRNKTSSAVRLRHGPTGLMVIAEESRSQHENRARAVRRLRQAIYLQVREPADGKLGAITAALTPARRLDVGRKGVRFL